MTKLSAATILACLSVAVVSIGCDGPERGEAAAATAAPAASQSGRSPAVVVKKDNPCSVLHPAEVARILGTPIEMREVVDEVTCHFDYVRPEPGGPPYFELKVYFEDGKTAVMATRMASKLLGGDAGFEKLAGIGDEAWLGPLASTLVFLKGNVGVELDLRMVPDGRDKGIQLAKLIAQRL